MNKVTKRSKARSISKSSNRLKERKLTSFTVKTCSNQECKNTTVKKDAVIFLDLYPDDVDSISELMEERANRRGIKAGDRPYHDKYQSPSGKMLSAPHELDSLIPNLDTAEKKRLTRKKRKILGKAKDSHQLNDKRSAIEKTPSENILYYIAKNNLRESKPKSLWWISNGVGQDSTCIIGSIANHDPKFKEYWENGKDKEYMIVFSDTGCEMPYTYDFYPDIVQLVEKMGSVPVILEKGADPQTMKIRGELEIYAKEMRKYPRNSPEYREWQKKRMALKKQIYEDRDLDRYEQFHYDTLLDAAFTLQPTAGIPTRASRSCTDKHKIQPIRKSLNAVTEETWGIRTMRGGNNWVSRGLPPHNFIIGFTIEEAYRAMPTWYRVNDPDKANDKNELGEVVKGGKGKQAVKTLMNSGIKFEDITREDLQNVSWTSQGKEIRLEPDQEVYLKKADKKVRINEIDLVYADVMALLDTGKLFSDVDYQVNHFPLIKARYDRHKCQIVNAKCGVNCGISGCFTCPFQSVGKYWSVKQLYPEEYERAYRMEREAVKYNDKLTLLGRKDKVTIDEAIAGFENDRKKLERNNPEIQQWMKDKKTKDELAFLILGEENINGFDSDSVGHAVRDW